MDSRPAPCGLLTLLTDFGNSDAYVAAMKGTAYSLSTELRIVDITHEVPSQDIFRAALILKQVAPTFPPGTVHVAVVDPGVGSDRKAVVVQSGGQLFVGPDNGLLTLAAPAPRRAFHLTNPDLMRPKLSDTFHGRDVFAPAGAHLACGVPLQDVGPELDSIMEIPLPRPTTSPGRIEGEVIFADTYGNLMVNIPEELLADLQAETVTLTVSGITVSGLRSTYADVAIGDLVAYIGSSGYLEVARREGNARHYLGAPRGARVVVRHG